MNSTIRYIILGIFSILWLYIIFAFVLGIENQFLFSIEEIQQKGNEKKLIIGKNNDIIFPELEDSTCIITETNNGFNVHLEKPVYLKIKDITQNLYPYICKFQHKI